MADSLEHLTHRLRAFAEARDWSRFHSPKNLAMALAGEVGELVAELQWLEGDQDLDDEVLSRLGSEAADVLIYLLRLSDVTGLDLLAEASSKLEQNEHRYPIDRVRGSPAKYTEYLNDRGSRQCAPSRSG